MNKVIQHIWDEIRAENAEELVPVFDKEKPIRSTIDLNSWYTSKRCENFPKSHINFIVFDSKLEYYEAKEINDLELVQSFAKNDHLGFSINYTFNEEIHKYYPDFILKMTNGDNIILETKGFDTQKDKTKRKYLDEWCRAINKYGGFGKWRWMVSFNTGDIVTKIKKLISS